VYDQGGSAGSYYPTPSVYVEMCRDGRLATENRNTIHKIKLEMKRSSSITTPAKRSKYIPKSKSKIFGAVRVPRGLGYKAGFPKQMKMTHKYVEAISFNFIATTLTIYYSPFGVNCLFDPLLAVGGHQPYYFDQMAALYNHYTVTGSRMVVEFVPTTNTPYVAGVFIDDDSSPAMTGLTTVCENQSANYKYSSGSNDPVVIRKKWDAKAAFGGNIMDNDNLQGDVAANPVETQSYIVFIGQPTGAPNVTVNAMVTIYYDTVWDELKTVMGS